MSQLRRAEAQAKELLGDFKASVLVRAFNEAHNLFVLEYGRAPQYDHVHFTGAFSADKVTFEIIEELPEEASSESRSAIPDYLEVTPAYGRTYKNAEEARADWEDGKDFLVTTGGYISKRSADKLDLGITLRYGKYAGADKLVNLREPERRFEREH